MTEREEAPVVAPEAHEEPLEHPLLPAHPLHHANGPSAHHRRSPSSSRSRHSSDLSDSVESSLRKSSRVEHELLKETDLLTSEDEGAGDEDSDSFADPSKKTYNIHGVPDLPRLSTASFLVHLLLGLTAQGLFGFLPGLSRYLQTRAANGVGMDAMITLCAPNALNIILLGVPLFYMYGFREVMAFRRKGTFLFISLSNTIPFVFANRLTLSIYVQLVVLSTPFLVVIASKISLSDPIKPFTYPAILLSTVGAFLALFGELIDSSEELSITLTDVAGFGLAFTYAVFLSMYFIFVRSLGDDTRTEVFMWWNFVFITFGTAPLTFALEDWTIWTKLEPIDYGALLAFGVGLFLGGQFLQAYIVRMIGAPLVGTLLPFRMVTALMFGAVLLEENLNALNLSNISEIGFIYDNVFEVTALIFGAVLLEENLNTLNLVGIAIVMLTTFAYVYYQYWREKRLGLVVIPRNRDGSVRGDSVGSHHSLLLYSPVDNKLTRSYGSAADIRGPKS